ncbi:uncharacterized protein [Procambarus clarkii]|uniref:uncharacterized protein isoform X1 n=2 Tax=Procambarus clarkii TaxID=6728 RepID=UPI003742D0FA
MTRACAAAATGPPAVWDPVPWDGKVAGGLIGLKDTSFKTRQIMVCKGVEKEEHIHRCLWENVGPVPDQPFAQYVMDKMKFSAEKDALIDAVSGEKFKYGDVISLVRNLSYGWQETGLEACHVVCLVTPNSIHAPPIFLAAVASSAVVTLANPLYTPDELRRHIIDSQSKWVIVHPLFLATVQAATKDLDDLKGIYLLGNEAKDSVEAVYSLKKEAPDNWECQGVCGDKVAHLPYSSGTTGLPKGVQLTATNWLAVLSTVGRKEYLYINHEDVVLGILPFFHTFGIGLMLASLTQGATMITLPRFIPDLFLNAIQTYKVTVLPLVPPLAIFVAKHELVEHFDLSSVTNVFSGAAPLSGEIQKLLAERLSGVTVRQGFGMTETTLGTLSSESRDVGAVGSVVAHCEAKIVDMESGDSLGPGERGELCFRGAIITKGYLNNEEATEELIDSEGWLHTGDVSYYNEKRVFYIVDRIKELIKYKGFQVPPAELEGLLMTHEAIADAGVIGVKDEEAEELPKAYIVLKPGRTVVPEDIVNWVKERVAPHKRLRGGVEITDVVPRSSAGKILRRKLREHFNV